MSEKVAVLGLDIGLRRVGVAGCDGLGLIATELTTVKRSSFSEDVAKFEQLICEREANLLVVGIPYTLNGEIGFQAKQVIKYAKRLSKALKIPVEFVDERLTSIEAEEQLKTDRRFSPRHDKHLIDQRAAAIILQQWLDVRR